MTVPRFAGTKLRELERIRLAAVAEGRWPAHSLAEWRRHAMSGRRRLAEGYSPTPLEAHAIAVDDAARRAVKPAGAARRR